MNAQTPANARPGYGSPSTGRASNFPWSCGTSPLGVGCAAAALLALALTACAPGDESPAWQVRHTPNGIAYSYEGDAPPVSAAYLEAAFDYYLDYWTQTRIYWNASKRDVVDFDNHIIFDCTFRCSGSPNGLCAGQFGNPIYVAYYQLSRSVSKPPDWERRLNPRTREDMYALSNGNRDWLNSENHYYWCAQVSPPMPALLHEWDHILFDPDDPLQNALVVPLPHSFIGPPVRAYHASISEL